MEGQKGGLSGITEKDEKSVERYAGGRPAYTQYTENHPCLHAHSTHTQVKPNHILISDILMPNHTQFEPPAPSKSVT